MESGLATTSASSLRTLKLHMKLYVSHCSLASEEEGCLGRIHPEFVASPI